MKLSSKNWWYFYQFHHSEQDNSQHITTEKKLVIHSTKIYNQGIMENLVTGLSAIQNIISSLSLQQIQIV